MYDRHVSVTFDSVECHVGQLIDCLSINCCCTGVYEVSQVGMVSWRHQESKGIT